LALFNAGANDRVRDPTRYAHRPTVLALEARILWLLGRVEEAVDVAKESVDEAVQLEHKLSLCCALASGACPVACWIGDTDQIRNYLSLLEPLSREMSLINWQGQAQCYSYALRVDGPGTSPHWWTEFDHLAASTHETLATVNWRFVTPLAIDRAKSGKAGYSSAEIFRALGENKLACGVVAFSEAERLFRTSLRISKSQGALSWQLRAATSLATLQQSTGRLNEAEDVLASAIDEMRQGHRSRDYVKAIAVLDQIRQRTA
jgi:hypothetical protein